MLMLIYLTRPRKRLRKMARVRKTTKMVMLETVMMVIVMLMTIFVMIVNVIMVMLISSFLCQ